MSIRTLLVANRGEIARRIFRTTHEMGMRSVAVFTDVDRAAPHVSAADVAVRLGDGSPRAYLDVDAVLEAAARSGADAIHPGYGFLAENAPFAQAVREAGLVWVGPSAKAIAAMGDKLAAKKLAAEAGVPTLPASEVAGDDPDAWVVQAAPVGYPLLVKATAGGGGKGMTVVAGPDALAEAVMSARRIALSAFGDPTVFVERLLPAPRHVEIQVLADRHGNAVHLGERECSIQRRHQKILEEAPSPALDQDLRSRMGEAAVTLASSIGYEGAGTVEFLLDGSGGSAGFVFLEMNTRLQVEHPVTEAVTGLDLVRLQLEIAAGHPIGFDQHAVRIEGHAIEVRIYAEDPARDWHPSSGRLHRWRPGSTPGVRYDDGVETGTEISTHYDPMLAKVISHAATREEAAARLARALRELQVHGPVTNRDLLVGVLEDADFGAGDTQTSFLEDHAELASRGADERTARHQLLLAALAGQNRRRDADDRWGFAPSGWRNVTSSRQQISYESSTGDRHDLSYRMGPHGHFEATVDGIEMDGGSLELADDRITLELFDRRISADLHTVGDTTYVSSPEGHTTWTELPRFEVHSAEVSAGGPLSPLPGTVVSVEVAAGDVVGAGQALVVLEAMKMEHRIEAHGRARVTEVLVKAGDAVDVHQLLVRLEELDDD